MEYTIIDDFLDPKDWEIIKETFFGFQKIHWYFNEGISYPNDGHIYFTHLFYNDNTIKSDLFYVVEPILLRLEAKALMRAKANLYLGSEKFIQHEFHKDLKFTHNGAVFYVNTNNGYTILNDEIKIESVENRVLLFDPSTLHASTNCTDKSTRLTININYFA